MIYMWRQGYISTSLTRTSIKTLSRFYVYQPLADAGLKNTYVMLRLHQMYVVQNTTQIQSVLNSHALLPAIMIQMFCPKLKRTKQ